VTAPAVEDVIANNNASAVMITTMRESLLMGRDSLRV